MTVALAASSPAYRRHDHRDPHAKLERDTEQSPPSSSRGHGGSLTKVTVNLIPRAFAALEEVSKATGENKTESINRAIQLYAWIQRMLDEGESIRVVSPDGAVREVQIF